MEELRLASLAIFVYFAVYTLATFALLGRSLWEAALVKVERGDVFRPPDRLRRPSIAIVAPAFDMAPTIVASVRSLLAVDYAPLQVVIVDDGSRDGTTAALVDAFDLVDLPLGDRRVLPTAPIERMYVSRTDPRLRVVRKQNGGRSDAVNAGLDVALTELVAIVDADTLLEADALKRVGEVFAADPEDVVAVGGTVRIANGAVIEHDVVTAAHVSGAGIEASQAAEYLRGFFGGRIAWSAINGLIIVSGAFGVFRRDLVLASGGLSKQTLGEDMELTMRLHHELRPTRPTARVAYAPDANAWTEIPHDLRPLRGQRVRWHVGLCDNLRLHRDMIGRRRYGAAGLYALPYTIAYELIAPVLQVVGYVIVAVLLAAGRVGWQYALAAVLVTLLVGQALTGGAILVEEVAFRRYTARDLARLGLWSLAELFWYRPLTAVWRLRATAMVLLGRRPGWGTIPRGGAIGHEADADLVAAPLTR